jgi:hypothetical protein
MVARKILGRRRSSGPLRRLTLAAACAALAVGACARHVDLGDIGDASASLLWTATFEPGDLSEWTGDAQGGVYTDNATLPPSATTVMAHNGRYAGVVTLSPTASMTSTNFLFRNQPSPAQAYYSAWYYVPSTVSVAQWLSLSHFTGSRTGDGTNLFAIWDVNLYPLPGGGLAAQLYDYVNQFNLRQTTPVAFPVDRWTQIEVLLAKATDTTGRVTVWQDGTLILDRSGLATVQNDWVQWDAGGASAELTPSPATVYLDDAAISLVRRGNGS